MQFQTIGHACLRVDHGETKLMIDPWILGSCYWRSWWHFPASVPVTDALVDVGWIYLTHEHFDHFHYPSMRRFNRSTKVLVPKLPRSRMREGLVGLGFNDVTELDHGVPFDLGGGLHLTSYQYGLDDSAVVVSDGRSSLLNLNDSKVTGPALRQVLDRYPTIDVMFRSHAPAQAYPLCYESEDPAELEFRRRDDYVDMFVAALKVIQPRYGVPFASNVCLLHRETYEFNAHNVIPPEVLAAAERDPATRGKVVVMGPGDTWESDRGFSIKPNTAYDDVAATIASLRDAAAAQLEKTYAEEDRVEPRFAPFEAYLTKFVRSLPPLAGFVFKPVLVFDQPKAAKRYWIVDCGRRVVRESEALPDDWSSLVTIHPSVIMDAVDKTIFNFIHISKRLHVNVRRGRMKEEFLFWFLMQLFEFGYLPITNVVSARAFEVIWSRRAELLGFAKMAVNRGRFEEKVVPRVY
jgi:UDP-MurNAc hydroxylase